jgi:hypothetical protein
MSTWKQIGRRVSICAPLAPVRPYSFEESHLPWPSNLPTCTAGPRRSHFLHNLAQWHRSQTALPAHADNFTGRLPLWANWLRIAIPIKPAARSISRILAPHKTRSLDKFAQSGLRLPFAIPPTELEQTAASYQKVASFYEPERRCASRAWP